MVSSVRQGSDCIGRWNVRFLTTLRSKLLWVIAASSFVHAQVGTAHGQAEATNPSTTISVVAVNKTAKPSLPERVERFCRDVENFPSSGDANDVQAKQFATKLREAILGNKRIARVTADDLSLETAKKLADYFHEDIAAALEYKEIIATPNILKTFLQAVRGEQIWRRMPLVTKHSLIPRPLKDVPEVLVTVGERDKLERKLAESTSKVKTSAELKQAYKDAYRGHRGWFKAIAPCFKEEDDDAE